MGPLSHVSRANKLESDRFLLNCNCYLLNFSGAFETTDVFLGLKLTNSNCITEKGKNISAEFLPIYDGLDDCLIKSVATKNATCLCEKFKKFHELDMKYAKELTNPNIRNAYLISAEETFKYGMASVEKIENNLFDWMEFNKNHKKVNDDLYDQMKRYL